MRFFENHLFLMKCIATVGFPAYSWYPEIILTAPVCPRSGGVSRNHLDGAAGPRHAMEAAAVGVAAVGCPELILTARVWPREIILTAQRGPATAAVEVAAAGCPEIILTAPVCPRSGGVSRNHLDSPGGPNKTGEVQL